MSFPGSPCPTIRSRLRKGRTPRRNPCVWGGRLGFRPRLEEAKPWMSWPESMDCHSLMQDKVTPQAQERGSVKWPLGLKTPLLPSDLWLSATHSLTFVPSLPTPGLVPRRSEDSSTPVKKTEGRSSVPGVSVPSVCSLFKRNSFACPSFPLPAMPPGPRTAPNRGQVRGQATSG